MKIIAWLVVILPLGWGVSQTVKNSLPLFGIGAKPAAVAPAK